MSSPQHCLAMAEEADRLAGIVSYERDKQRLRDQAAAWRQMAGAAPKPLVAAPCEAVSDARHTSSFTGWLNRRRA